MAKINLTEGEKAKLIKLINDGLEIPLELLQKLGPGFFDKLAQEGKFDFATLEKFKVPTLEYAGKRAENIILASAALTGGNAPLQVERCFESGNVTNGKSQLTIFEESRNEHNNWRNLIIQGDNLQFLKTCYLNKDALIKDKVKGKVKLVYIDPPFGTGDEYGGNEGEYSYSAKLMGSEYVEFLRERLIFLKYLLDNKGLIFVRQGYNFSHYVKITLDDVFGKENFINEIVVNRGKQRLGGKNKYSTATDTVYLYSKTKQYDFTAFTRPRYPGEATGTNFLMKGWRNPPERKFVDPEGNNVVLLPPPNNHWKFIQSKIDIMYQKDVIYLAKSNKGLSSGIRKIVGNKEIPVDYVPSFKFDTDKTIDSNWTDISGYSQTTGYPTENSEELLERVLITGSSVDDLVIDVFGGSGTTGAVAEKLGRRWIMCDFGKHSIYTMQKRMFRIAESKKLGQEAGKNAKYGKGPMPFCVASCGGYDFTRIMNLRENKDAYISFVLGLFNLTKPNEDYQKKYKLPRICTEKDGDPVEVYPVWEDEYLKNIKIDKDYLQGIVDQSGGKLKGNFYIITPVSCTKIIGDITLENAKKEQVHFRILSFPYKILEEASRSFEIKEQPSSSKNINDLITSVGFYFNEQVEVSAKKTTSGIQITKFKSEITDSSGNKYEGMAGLAMVLVDKDYNGKVFDMEEAVYGADIKDDGKITIGGITADTHIIAIDKHGNESKITPVK